MSDFHAVKGASPFRFCCLLSRQLVHFIKLPDFCQALYAVFYYFYDTNGNIPFMPFLFRPSSDLFRRIRDFILLF